jgi:transposase
MKKQTITLTTDDRTRLEKIVGSGAHQARVITRARILLKADEQLGDEAIAQALDVGLATVGRIRRRYVQDGLEIALYDKPRPGSAKKLDPKAEALVIATACSPAPNGRSHWALRLLADKVVELGLAESISYETIRRTLKKTI